MEAAQLSLFENPEKDKKKRKYNRDHLGQFLSKEKILEEKLRHDNEWLTYQNKELERKVIALINYQRILILEVNKNKLL